MSRVRQLISKTNEIKTPITRSKLLVLTNRTTAPAWTSAFSSKSTLQPKLTINQPGDKYEQEADRVASAVMRASPPPHLQRKSDGIGGVDAPPSVNQTLNHTGQSLDAGTQSFMESRFGQDFSGVRVHTDRQAAQSAEEVNARAYTVGKNVVFGAGQYAPNTSDGQKLIAHELTHTVQQHSPIVKADSIVQRVTQEPTINEAKKSGKKLSPQYLGFSDTMDVNTLANMTPIERRDWYVAKLGAYENQLKESADIHYVPVQLLATVLLNELADIDFKDVLQSGLSVTKGSLGIAQIQIDTAINDNLFPDLTEAEGKSAYDEVVASTPHATSKMYLRWIQNKDKERRMAVNKRLQIPQQAINAAAREIRILLDQMVANSGASWQTRFGFTDKGVRSAAGAQSIYANIAGASQKEKEHNLANMITGAYNSPKIIGASDSSESKFPNANIHGMNSTYIADDLFDFVLFRP